MEGNRKYTLFIATIALVAPFIPVEIEVLAYNAYKRNLEIMKNGNPVNLLRRKKKKDLFSPPVCELLHP
jgi:hypothetical protein